MFIASGLLYVATANRDLQWQDSGWQQFRIVSGQLDHPLGLALVHPIQYYLGRVAVRMTSIEPAFAITLLSSLAAAMAVANLACTLFMLSRRLLPAIVASTALMLSHTFWQQATHTESYAIMTAFLTAEWLCLAGYATTSKGRWLILLVFFNGAGIANHLLASLATPVDLVIIILAFRKKHLAVREMIIAALLWAGGTAPYSVLVLVTIFRTHDLGGTVHSALFGKYASAVLNTDIGLKMIVLSCSYMLYNFPGMTIPLGLYALFAKLSIPKIFLRAIKFQLVFYLLFAVRYIVKDQYTFFIPVYTLLALLSGLALAEFMKALSGPFRKAFLALSMITALWTPVVYVGVCSMLKSRGGLESMVGNKPYRDGYRAFFIPWGIGEDHAVQVNRQAIELAGPDGLILVDDEMILVGLQYEQVCNRIPGSVSVMEIKKTGSQDIIAGWRLMFKDYLASNRSVVLVPRDRNHPDTCVPEAQWSRLGDLYILTSLSNP